MVIFWYSKKYCKSIFTFLIPAMNKFLKKSLDKIHSPLSNHNNENCSLATPDRVWDDGLYHAIWHYLNDKLLLISTKYIFFWKDRFMIGTYTQQKPYLKLYWTQPEWNFERFISQKPNIWLTWNYWSTKWISFTRRIV